MSVPEMPAFMAEQRHASRLLRTLVVRARATGRVRADFEHQDVAMLMYAIGGVAAVSRDSAQTAWQRIAAMVIDGIQADRESLPPAPTTQQLYRTFAIEQLSKRRPVSG